MAIYSRKLFLILFVIALVNCTSEISEKHFNNQLSDLSIVQAMADVIRKFYIANHLRFDIIIYGERTQNINDVITGVRKELSEEVAVNIYHIRKIEKWNHQIIQSAVILTENRENLEYLHYQTKTVDGFETPLVNPTPKTLKFLVYVEKIRIFQHLSAILDNASDVETVYAHSMRSFEIFMINAEKTVDLAVNLLYSDSKCGNLSLKMLNSFNKLSRKWKKDLKNFDHFNEFRNCVIYFLLPLSNLVYNEEAKIYIQSQHLSDKQELINNLLQASTKPKPEFHGIIPKFIETIAERANFTPHYTTYFVGRNPLEADFFGSINYRPNNDIAFVLGTVVDIKEFRHLYFNTKPFAEMSFYYLVMPNDLYTNYEKLLFPFDFTTWMLLLLTFGFTFGVILGLTGRSKRTKAIFFGAGIKMPAYDVVSIFFGIGQTRLPRESLNRFILTLFIWFCLIFRTCYQSKLFEFMTSDMRKPTPETIQDLIKWNYTIAVEDTHMKEFIQYNDAIINGREPPNIVIVQTQLYISLYHRALSGTLDQKMAFLIQNVRHAQLNGTFRDSLPIMKSEIMWKPLALQLQRNNMFFSHFERVIEDFNTAGISKYLVDFDLWYMNRPFDVEVEDPLRILSMTDLEFGFVIWLFSCFLSFLIFLWEIRLLLFKLLRDFIGLIGLLRLFIARLSGRW